MASTPVKKAFSFYNLHVDFDEDPGPVEFQKAVYKKPRGIAYEIDGIWDVAIFTDDVGDPGVARLRNTEETIYLEEEDFIRGHYLLPQNKETNIKIQTDRGTESLELRPGGGMQVGCVVIDAANSLEICNLLVKHLEEYGMI
jgi:hypothetical protein